MEPRCYCQSRVDTCDSLDNNVDINLKLVNPAVPKITIIRGEVVVVGLGLKPWQLGTKIDNSRILATAKHILQNRTETTLPPFMQPNNSSAKRLYVSKASKEYIVCLTTSGLSGKLLGLNMGQQAFTSIPQHIQHLRDASHAHISLGADICCKMTDLNTCTAGFLTGVPLIDHCHWQPDGVDQSFTWQDCKACACTACARQCMPFTDATQHGIKPS